MATRKRKPRKPKAKVKTTDLIPAEVNPNPDFEPTENIAQDYPVFARLTYTQLRVLVAVAQNLLSEKPLTGEQIAQKIGVNRKTLWNCRQNKNFNIALAVIMREVVRGVYPDRLIASIYKASEKDWRASEFLLKYSGAYIPRSQRSNMNIQASENSQFATAKDAIDAFLIRLGELGWNSQRLAKRFDELRREGAF